MLPVNTGGHKRKQSLQPGWHNVETLPQHVRIVLRFGSRYQGLANKSSPQEDAFGATGDISGHLAVLTEGPRITIHFSVRFELPRYEALDVIVIQVLEPQSREGAKFPYQYSLRSTK